MASQDAPGDDAGFSIGDRIGPYVIEGLLGRGGMGYVFRARDQAGGTTVALKVLKPTLATDLEYRRRFVHEARALSEVQHPNLVDFLELGEHEDRPYIAMRYVPGRSLGERIRDEGALSIPESLRICREVAAGLDHLHRAGLVHRDVKCSNVVLDADGSATLTDFGLAKGDTYSTLTRTGEVVGSIAYLAPELIVGEPVGPHSDIYSLACVVFECLTATQPFTGDSMTEMAVTILTEPPPDPCASRDDCSMELSLAVVEGLAKAPERRPSSAGAYSRRLEEAAMGTSEPPLVKGD